MGQGIEAIDAFAGDEYYAAAVAAVAAVGTAARHVFLPMEGNATVAPFSGFKTDFYFVYKHVVPTLK
jgi:hypothetical protein